MAHSTRVVIHRGNPRWFEIRGRRYEVRGGSANSRDELDAGWGYTVTSAEGDFVCDEVLAYLYNVRDWAQEWEDNPEWGYPEDAADAWVTQ